MKIFMLYFLLLRLPSELLSVNRVFCVTITGFSKTHIYICVYIYNIYIYIYIYIYIFFFFLLNCIHCREVVKYLACHIPQGPWCWEQGTFLPCSWFHMEEAANYISLCPSPAPPLGRGELIWWVILEGRTGQGQLIPSLCSSFWEWVCPQSVLSTVLCCSGSRGKGGPCCLYWGPRQGLAEGVDLILGSVC